VLDLRVVIEFGVYETIIKLKPMTPLHFETKKSKKCFQEASDASKPDTKLKI
jgi:hypothetical protein